VEDWNWETIFYRHYVAFSDCFLLRSASGQEFDHERQQPDSATW